MKQSKKKHSLNAPARSYLSQTAVPAFSLDDALRVPLAIYDNYGGKPTRPLSVAQAMQLSPTSSQFRMLCGAAIAYGITEGGYNAASISITDLGRKILRPLSEGGDQVAKREALLKPRVCREFLSKYDGSRLPRTDIAYNVLEELGVPRPSAEDVLKLLLESANSVGFLKVINDHQYVDLDDTPTPLPINQADEKSAEVPTEDSNSRAFDEGSPHSVADVPRPLSRSADILTKDKLDSTNRRVFITHGKNRKLVPQLKQLLEYGEFEPVVSIESESVAKPVTDKVLDEMRSCGAAIIHVAAEIDHKTPDGSVEKLLNQNVLIEIGAAIALYGRRFILLVENGVKLPSNLQGLYEVRYSGETLDSEATLKLLKAFKDFKGLPVEMIKAPVSTPALVKTRNTEAIA